MHEKSSHNRSKSKWPYPEQSILQMHIPMPCTCELGTSLAATRNSGKLRPHHSAFRSLPIRTWSRCSYSAFPFPFSLWLLFVFLIRWAFAYSMYPFRILSGVNIPSPSSSTLDLSAHLHVTTCIDFGSCRLSGCLFKAIPLFLRHT